MKDFIISILPILRPLLDIIWQLFITIVAPGIISWLAFRIVSLLKITDDKKKAEVEASLRDALHAAARNALLYAMTKYGLRGAETSNMSESLIFLARQAGSVEGDVGNKARGKLEDILDAAVNEYLIPKMPETIKKLNVTDAGLADIVLSKVPTV